MKDTTLTIRISHRLKEAAIKQGEQDHRTLTGYVTHLIEKDLEKKKPTEKK